jgi:hypothetical protein
MSGVRPMAPRALSRIISGVDMGVVVDKVKRVQTFKRSRSRAVQIYSGLCRRDPQGQLRHRTSGWYMGKMCAIPSVP